MARLGASGLAAAATLRAGSTSAGAAAALLLRVAPLSDGGQPLLATQQLGAQQAAALGSSCCRLLRLLLSLRQQPCRGKQALLACCPGCVRSHSCYLSSARAASHVCQCAMQARQITCALILRVPNGARLGAGAGASSSSSTSCSRQRVVHKLRHQITGAGKQASLWCMLLLQAAGSKTPQLPARPLTSSSTMRRNT